MKLNNKESLLLKSLNPLNQFNLVICFEIQIPKQSASEEVNEIIIPRDDSRRKVSLVIDLAPSLADPVIGSLFSRFILVFGDSARKVLDS
jgi:hypothetical protein